MLLYFLYAGPLLDRVYIWHREVVYSWLIVNRVRGTASRPNCLQLITQNDSLLSPPLSRNHHKFVWKISTTYSIIYYQKITKSFDVRKNVGMGLGQPLKPNLTH